jgi:predicted acyl esterase
MAENFPGQRDAHPLDDAFWAEKRPNLEAIDVPALVCAGWSDHGLHTRGSLEGYERIASKETWLFTHGRRKWETFYETQWPLESVRYEAWYLNAATQQLTIEPCGHGHTVNRGTHTIHTGERFDSHLLAPVVRADATRN